MQKREKTRKATAEELRLLNDRYQIEFEGPIPTSCWPSEYAHIFQNIRAISRTFYDDYQPTQDLLSTSEKKNGVRKLNQAAYSCRKARLDEDEWRFKTEVKVVARFSSEVVWYVARVALLRTQSSVTY